MNNCPKCGNIGWIHVQCYNQFTQDIDTGDEPCDCQNDPDSVFNVVEGLRAQLAEAQAYIHQLESGLDPRVL